MNTRTLIIPAFLLAVTFVAMIGCIPIPSSQQFQPDNTLRPEYFVGTEKGKPIWLGHTTLSDAYVFLSQHVHSYLRSESEYMPGGEAHQDLLIDTVSRWRFTLDGRQAWLRFETRSGFILMPLCFAVRQESKQHWLVLDFDDRQVVTATHTVETSEPPEFSIFDFEKVFDEKTRQRLAAANVWFDNQSPLLRGLKQMHRGPASRSVLPR